MKIGYYCESPADQAAMAVFVEGILGAPAEPINVPLAGQSMPAFFSELDGAFRGIHYLSDAEALVIMCDSDDSGVHDHFRDCENAKCRRCRSQSIVDRIIPRLRPVVGKTLPKLAYGLAVEAVECWYLTGTTHDSALGEARWMLDAREGRRPYPRDKLKELVYGTSRPSIKLETDRAVAAARRIVDGGLLGRLEAQFPSGFGLMATEIRAWGTPPAAAVPPAAQAAVL